MKKIICIIVISLLSGCVSVPNENKSVVKKLPPQLWSTHKELNVNVSLCALKGVSALKSLGFTSVVQNKNFVYGNFHDNRAAVKCVAKGKNSFVYLAVAGPDKNIVEKLRNEISWKM